MLSSDKVGGKEAASAVPVAASSVPVAGAPPKATANQGAHAISPPQKHHHIWLVTGPAGCGKTTVAEYLADALKMPYIEGDSDNVKKMRNDTPLTDGDRWDWLGTLRDESMLRVNEGSNGVVVTCSALKRKYRDVIRVAAYHDHHIRVHFIFLHAPVEVLLQRVMKRQGHYMGPNMVQSQLDILERPAEDEWDVVSIDVRRSLDEVKKDALASVVGIIQADRD